MKWQQTTMMFYIALMLAIGMFMNGKPRTGKYSFVSVFIEMGLLFVVLSTAGFWD